MLTAALEFRQVFPRFSTCDANYLWLHEVEDWRRAEEVCKFLEIFREVTDSISRTKYPTANMFLPEVWKIKEALNEKSRDENRYMQYVEMKRKEKCDKYWGEYNLLMAIAAVLDPRYKMTFIKFCFPKIYDEVESKKNIELVSGSLLEVYKEYVLNHALHCSNVTKESSVVGEGVYIYEVNLESQFDVIGWWKWNNLKYIILSKMVVDILSIPITTVASEAAFSTGGRVIDPYRASLSTKTVEALICGGDWIRSLYGVKEVYTRTTEEVREIELPQYVCNTDKLKEQIVTFVVTAWEIPV
ncbi:hypothetical protein RJ640_008981 [Escallonia rubra]|uniref:Uncharacterized protein n=1 Tax=Escallonia rubra TaxID=112253 RepID=A0AA88S0Q5_9ASTE|nr:hypothetical protein RJ640_008981 [Escallonia rubra]